MSYKATRPDGTDFYSGEVDYAAALRSGETLRHPEKFRRNDPETYFSVATSPTDCTGMNWPCRLFVVELVGRAFRNDSLPNKRCCKALRVIEERPAHEALGPQGPEVVVLLKRCETLTREEVQGLHAAWAAARDAAGAAAWAAARNAASTTGRDAAWAAAMCAAKGAGKDATRAAARAAARAVVVQDLISQEHFNTLYGPWKKAIK